MGIDPETVSIWVVERSSQRHSLARLLEGAGFSVQAFESGPELLAHYAGERPDLIVVDLDDSPAQCLQSCRPLIRDSGLDSVPVLNISANAYSGRYQSCLACGVDEILPRPFAFSSLLAKISHHVEIARKHSGRSARRRIAPAARGSVLPTRPYELEYRIPAARAGSFRVEL
ncbi:MAG: response regulator [Cyanobacteria bacterium REEB65]|nr:response regulator [Cyanobacteria bacterium REEB65]